MSFISSIKSFITAIKNAIKNAITLIFKTETRPMTESDIAANRLFFRWLISVSVSAALFYFGFPVLACLAAFDGLHILVACSIIVIREEFFV